MMMRRTPTIILLVILISLGVVTFIVTKKFSTGKVEHNGSLVNESKNAAATETAIDPDTKTPSAGIYKAYSEESVVDANYDRSLVFFHAPWCPQCRAFEQSINAGSIPAGTQILKADYDSSTDLKKKYGVTLQTTFVQVDKSGNQLKKWVGYTSDHTLKTLLEQFGG